MIKLLKEGPKDFIKVCPYCGSKFSYGIEDISKIYGTDLKKINCPKCNEVCFHKIDENKLYE